MEELDRIKLRLACLEIAKQVSLASAATYGIESLADTYWRWLSKPNAPDPSTLKGVAKGDEIPF